MQLGNEFAHDSMKSTTDAIKVWTEQHGGPEILLAQNKNRISWDLLLYKTGLLHTTSYLNVVFKQGNITIT